MEKTKSRIIDIACANCGAAASFDIIHQNYCCTHCGSKVSIEEAGKLKQGFRKIHADRLRSSLKNHRLFSAVCTGCGANVVFEENEALSRCAFCGKSLLRRDYLLDDDLPEYVIPFAITQSEASELLLNWCRKNRTKPESAKLLDKADGLKGFYLPYELVRGPVHLKVSRMDGGRIYSCEGFISDEFVNRSKQLDNLLLDGMEPYDLDELTEFDPGYIAGQRVKISDISDNDLEKRAISEVEKLYTPAVRRVLETRAVDVSANVSCAMKLPVLLPVYYISDGEAMAAVNGQSGKVAVRAVRDSHYYFLPWWLKAVLATLIFALVSYGALRLFHMEHGGALYIAGILSLFFIIVTLCLYSDTTRNSFSVVSGRKIYTSEDSFTRENRELVASDKDAKRKVSDPVFFEKLDGTSRPVVLKFTTPMRVFRMALLCLVALFLPVIVALFLNGFDFERLNLGGSAVWFCIAVPVVPIYLLKFGIVELHNNPLIYTLEDGKAKRYRRKFTIDKDLLKIVLKALFVPPASIAVWIGIIVFIVMCFLTAYGFE